MSLLLLLLKMISVARLHGSRAPFFPGRQLTFRGKKSKKNQNVFQNVLQDASGKVEEATVEPCPQAQKQILESPIDSDRI
jgi:hypothetical protein